MAEPQSAVLSIYKHAAKTLNKLDRGVKSRFEDFQAKFCYDMNANSLRLKKLKGDNNLYSARVTGDYRAILVRISPRQFMLIDVRKREEVYDRVDERYEHQVNEVTGAFEVVDHENIKEAIARAEERPKAERVYQPSKTKPDSTGLFAGFKDEELVELGVAEMLLPSVRAVETDEQLEGLLEALEANPVTQDILLSLATGVSPEDVMERVTAPVKATEPVDTTDLETAVSRPTSMVSSSDDVVHAMLESGFDTWRLWLHPAQRHSVTQHFNGPARVSGGPGTGKTVVALHRAMRLAQDLGGEATDKILFTTFTNNLANDLREKLTLLGGADILKRIDVVGIDALARRLANENNAITGPFIKPEKLTEMWQTLCLETGETDFDAEFLRDEWLDVMADQLITSRGEYFNARRVRRPRRLNRAQRARIWELAERFNKRLANNGGWCFEQLRASAAIAEESRAKTGQHRCKHVVVDEAQDLTAAHWRMLRAIVPEGPNDMFIAGDSFQRIYGQPITLARLGINIRGRSSRLSLNYRTTKEILQTALAIEGGQPADDLDGGSDSLAGYKSVMSGDSPEFFNLSSQAEELDRIVAQVKEWTQEYALHTVAITTPRNRQVNEVIEGLRAAGIPADELKPSEAPEDDHVHVGTMHRLKGLEYRYLIISGLGAKEYPFSWIADHRKGNPERYELEMDKARNLLFVAATRARDKVVFTWTGEPSPLLNLQGG